MSKGGRESNQKEKIHPNIACFLGKTSLAKNFQIIFRGVGVGLPTLLQDLWSTGQNDKHESQWSNSQLGTCAWVLKNVSNVIRDNEIDSCCLQETVIQRSFPMGILSFKGYHLETEIFVKTSRGK